MYNDSGILYSHEPESFWQPFKYVCKGYRDNQLVNEITKTVYCQNEKRFQALIAIWNGRGGFGTNKVFTWEYMPVL